MVQVIGRLFDWTVPNVVTAVGLVLALIASGLFLIDVGPMADATAVFLGTNSYLTDFVDGKLAAYQQGAFPVRTLEDELRFTLWERFTMRGVTHFGKFFDPLVDKIRFISLLLAVMHRYVDVGLVVSIIALAFLLMFIRPLKRRLGVTGDSGANWVGKTKVWVEAAFICCIVFTTRPLMDGMAHFYRIDWVQKLTHGVGLLSLLFGFGSLLLHLFPRILGQPANANKVS